MASFVEPCIWIIVSIMGLFIMIINGRICCNECKKRRAGTAKFITIYLKWWSFLCIASGPIIGLFVFLRFFDGFCHFAWHIQILLVLEQPKFMGFYQLSRLYYCFAKSQVYHNRGYSNWLFIVMYIIGILLFINDIPFLLFNRNIPTNCGINKNGQYYPWSFASSSISSSIILIWFTIMFITYLIWDIVTLLLYGFKIRSFGKYKSENITIYNRISSILYRVLILTLFYQIMTLISCIFGVIGVVIFDDIFIVYYSISLLLSVIYTYSMYLMLQHNTSEYSKFIKILYLFRLHFMCCRFRSIMIEQINDLNLHQQQSMNATANDNAPNNEETAYETHDISVNHAKIEAISPELSIDTTVKK